MTTARDQHEYTRAGVLQGVANPELYRANAFRVLGVSTRVEGQELSRRLKRLRMQGRFGEGAAVTESSVLPLIPAAGAEELRRAEQRVLDIQARAVDEFFWFWPAPNPGPNDDGFSCLRGGDVSGARAAWASIPRSDPHWCIANHNQAVMHHALALDLERRCNGNKDGSAGTLETLEWLWKTALTSWAALAEDDATWACVLARAAELDDPRLTAGFVAKMRSSLAETILTVNETLAWSAMKEGRLSDAGRHLLLIRDSGFRCEAVGRILERLVSPWVTNTCDTCDRVAKASEESPETLLHIARSLVTEFEPKLALMREVLEESNPLRQKASTRLVRAAGGCAIDYANATDDLKGALEILEALEPYAIDEEAGAWLRRNVDLIRENLAEQRDREALKEAVTDDRVYEVMVSAAPVRVASVCTCCLGPPEQSQEVSHQWEETRGLTRYSRSVSLKFPVCTACRRHQADFLRKRTLLPLSAAAISTAIVYLVHRGRKQPEPADFLIGAVVTLVVTFLLGALIRLKILPHEHASRSKAVSIVSARGERVRLRFHNPLYAHAFAEANDLDVQERRLRKPTRGAFLLAGREMFLLIVVAVSLGALGQLVTYAVHEDDWQRRPPVQYSPAPRSWPVINATPGPPSSSSRAYSRLSDSIAQGKARVEVLESALEVMDRRLEQLESRIARRSQEVDGFASQVRAGRPVNRTAYEQAVETHNQLVKEYNDLIAQRGTKYREYSNELNAVNELIRRFNRGER